MSYPGISGRWVPNSFAYFPLSVSGSAGLTLLAITRTSASSSLGSGRCIRSILSTSGAPYSWATTACIFGFSSARIMQTDRTPKAVKLKSRRVDRANCMISRSRAMACGANWQSYFARCQCGEPYLLADIDEDLPALDTLQFENAVLHPRIVFHFLSHSILVIGIDDQHRAVFIDQRSAHQNKTLGN